MTSPQSQPRRLPTLARYLIAVGAVVVAGLARWGMTRAWGPEQLPYFFFFLTAILVAWWLRLGPALLTLVAGVAVANWFFIAPRGAWTLGPELIRMSSFLVSSLAAIIAIEAIHRANAHAQAELAERRRSQEALAEAARRQDTLYHFV